MSSPPIHLLLIEDNPGDARLLRALLQETGSSQFELVHAERFSEALTRLSERRFDVVLLDLSLPDAQGIETISSLSGHGCRAARAAANTDMPSTRAMARHSVRARASTRR